MSNHKNMRQSRPPRVGPLRWRSLAWTALLALFTLGGCAAHWNYKDGKTLLAEQRVDEALDHFEHAAKLEPGNVEYRNGLLLARRKALSEHLELAVKALGQGQLAEADRHYRRVLEIDPENAQARDGLHRLAQRTRHDRLLAKASSEVEAKRPDAAQPLLLTVLDEDPGNERARVALRLLRAEAEAKAIAAKQQGGLSKPVSIDFKDATIKQVFDVISRTAGLNFVFDKDVKTDQRTTLSLKDSTVEAAIRFVLLTNQLDQLVMDSNTILIYPNSAAKVKEYQPLVVKTFILENSNAKAVAEMIKTLVKSRDVVIDEKLNMVILRDHPDAIRLAEKLVALQDVAEPEVMLEVEILEVTRSRLTELGVAWPVGLTLTPLASAEGTALTVKDLRSLTRETLGAAIDPMKLNARQVDGDTNLLANPRIRVLNREKAKIVIGNRVPSINTSVIATGIISESVTYLDVGLKLEVEPIVYVNNDVAIKISLEVSNVLDTQTSKQGTTTYNIGTRSANTSLRLKDGENQVLAGLINDEDRRTANRVPGLGDLPIAGRLFGSHLNDGKKTEIVLSITPRLIRNVQRLAGRMAEFSSGTEGSMRSRPDVAPELAAPVPAAVPANAAGAPAQPVVPKTPGS